MKTIVLFSRMHWKEERKEKARDRNGVRESISTSTLTASRSYMLPMHLSITRPLIFRGGKEREKDEEAIITRIA